MKNQSVLWAGIFMVGIIVGVVLLPKLFSKPAAMPAVFQTEGVSLAQAVERGASEGKPVLAFATAEWCGYCQVLKKGALADARVQELIGSSFVPVTLEETSRQGHEDLKTLPVSGFPTLLVIRDGEVVDQTVGAVSTDDLYGFLGRNK